MSLVFRTWVDTSAFYVEIKDRYTHFKTPRQPCRFGGEQPPACGVQGFEQRLIRGMDLPCLMFPVLGLTQDISILRL